MNLLDLTLIILLALGIGLGIQRGFLKTSLDLMILVISAVAGALLYRPVASFALDRIEGDPATVNAGALVLTALVVLSLLNVLNAWAISPHLSALRAFRPVQVVDSSFGVVPGFVYGLLFASMITVIVGLIPLGDGVNRSLAESDLANRLRSAAQLTTSTLARETGMDVADFTYIVTTESHETYRIPPTIPDHFVADPDAEARIAELVNGERAARGLSILEYDPDLVPVARAHSAEMVELGYFSHTSPNTGTLRDRMQAAGIEYIQAGENLAYAPTVEVAHRGLMQSPGHRANILEPSYQRIGIGVIVTRDGTIMVTQLFTQG